MPDGIYSFLPHEGRISWLHADGTAWIVLSEYAALTIDCRNKSGYVNQFGPWNFQMQGRLLTAAIVHGRGPTNNSLSYSYIILPNVTIDTIASFSNRYISLKDNLHTLENRQLNNSTLHMHATCHPSVHRASFVLFENASTLGDGIFSNCSALSLSVYMERAAAFLYSENSDSFTITAAHPTLCKEQFLSVSIEVVSTQQNALVTCAGTHKQAHKYCLPSHLPMTCSDEVFQ